jgi:hypothetical protein
MTLTVPFRLSFTPLSEEKNDSIFQTDNLRFIFFSVKQRGRGCEVNHGDRNIPGHFRNFLTFEKPFGYSLNGYRGKLMGDVEVFSLRGGTG